MGTAAALDIALRSRGDPAQADLTAALAEPTLRRLGTSPRHDR